MTRKKQNSKVIMEQKKRRRAVLTFWRIVKYGANSFSRNAWLSVAATAVMTITLLIIFSSFLARTILNNTVDEIRNKVDISIYLKKEVTQSVAEEIEKKLESLENVKEVNYVSAEKVRSDFATNNGSDEDVQTAIKEASNEFFGVMNVKLEDLNKTEELQKFVEETALIKDNLHPDHEPTYSSSRKKTIDNISNTVNFAEKVGLLAAAVFMIIASLIIFNTIRMAIFNRREEIYMMKLIGANKNFISGPFLVESIICGILASIFATGLGLLIISLAKPKLEAYGIIIGDLFANYLNYFVIILPVLMIIGAAIGVFSAWIATRKYLKI